MTALSTRDVRPGPATGGQAAQAPDASRALASPTR